MSSNIQPDFVWQDGRQFDGRSQYVVVPHGPEWLLAGGTLVLDFTAGRLKGAQGLLSKDAKGKLDGGHLTIWLEDGKVAVRLQDKMSGYVIESPSNTVKREVPTRLALAFGPGGMKLYVDGKIVGSNAYQGGLQDNQEPVVIGARDWKSGPRAADHLEAYFAGTISALALYGRPLEAPAVAALGPAGIALAQAAAPEASVSQPLSVDVVLGRRSRSKVLVLKTWRPGSASRSSSSATSRSNRCRSEGVGPASSTASWRKMSRPSERSGSGRRKPRPHTTWTSSVPRCSSSS